MTPRRLACLVLGWLAVASHGAALAQPPLDQETSDWPVVIAKLRQEVQRRPSHALMREQLAIAYNNYGVSLSDAGQWDQAVAQLQEAIRVDPRNEQFRQNLANIYLNQAQVAFQHHRATEALTTITAALELNPTLADAYVLRGEIEYGRQRLKEARAAWQRAIELDPSQTELAERMKQLTQELSVESNFERISQAYFDLRYEDAFERPAGFDIRDALLEARREVGSDFAYWPKYKLVVLIYSDEHFRALRQETPEWLGGLFDGKIRVPLPGYGVNVQRVREILFHEYTHAVVHDLSKGRCPKWLNEGLATYEEMRHGALQSPRLFQAMTRSQLLPWAELNDQFMWGLSAEQVELGYQQSYSIVTYLIERYGFWRMRRLLKAVSDGQPFEEALPQEYRLKMTRLETTWREWLPEWLRSAR